MSAEHKTPYPTLPHGIHRQARKKRPPRIGRSLPFRPASSPGSLNSDDDRPDGIGSRHCRQAASSAGMITVGTRIEVDHLKAVTTGATIEVKRPSRRPRRPLPNLRRRSPLRLPRNRPRQSLPRHSRAAQLPNPRHRPRQFLSSAGVPAGIRRATQSTRIASKRGPQMQAVAFVRISAALLGGLWRDFQSQDAGRDAGAT